MKSTLKLGAMALAAMLVLSVFAPAALAAGAAGNDAGNTATTAGNASVTTSAATNVNNTSATLNGDLSGLAADENAEIYFVYWEAGNESDAIETASAPTDDDAAFIKNVTGLENDTTYVYVAYANVTNETTDESYTVSGDKVWFTTGSQTADGDADVFGQKVSAFVHQLLENSDSERGIGQMVSEYVTQNNPGADKRPDHAGPKDKAEKESGPPEDKGPDWKSDDVDTQDSDDEDEDGEDESDDDEHPGNGNAKGKSK